MDKAKTQKTITMSTKKKTTTKQNKLGVTTNDRVIALIFHNWWYDIGQSVAPGANMATCS
jgi:hypothetical protein